MYVCICANNMCVVCVNTHSARINKYVQPDVMGKWRLSTLCLMWMHPVYVVQIRDGFSRRKSWEQCSGLKFKTACCCSMHSLWHIAFAHLREHTLTSLKIHQTRWSWWDDGWILGRSHYLPKQRVMKQTNQIGFILTPKDILLADSNVSEIQILFTRHNGS